MPKGQSITEYALALGLVAIVVIGTMAMLGNTVQIGLNSIIPGPSQQAPTTPPSSPAIALPPKFAGLTARNEPITLANGKTLNLVSLSPEEVLEVSGGNGLSEAALFQMQQLITALEKNDPTNPIIEALKELAAQGEDVSQVQAGIAAATSGATPQLVEYNGQQLTLDFALNEINSLRNVTPYYAPEDLAQAQNEALKLQADLGIMEIAGNRTLIDNFNLQYGALLNDPALQNDPALAQKVRQLSGQIIASANSTSNNIATGQVKELVGITQGSALELCKSSGSNNCLQ